MESVTAGHASATGIVHRILHFGIATALLAPIASAQTGPTCVALKNRPLQAIGAIHLDAGGQPPWLQIAASRAASMWNDPACNVARAFPTIVLTPTREPHRRVRLRWEPGSNPAEPRSCGSFVGSEIVLYGSAIDPRTGALGGCGDRDRITETLAHEIGHVLGLTDRYEPACYGTIMSQLVWVGDHAALPRAVRPFECAAADIAFETPAERQRPGRPSRLLAFVPPEDSDDDAAARGLVTLLELAAPLPPRSARTALDSPATTSIAFHP